jgi:methylenetetrahydrofolate dehydrogenase (NADP+)/methenyltetrahydrofolate cyclohydrolase
LADNKSAIQSPQSEIGELMGELIDGAGLARKIQEDVGAEVARLAGVGVKPGLAVVLVGDDPASHVYVRNKVRVCEALGMHSEKIELPSMATTEEILRVVRRLNERDDIHGVLVQLPLPRQVDTRAVISAVSPDKDVDGIHPANVGLLVAGRAVLKPCTPAGIMEMLRSYAIPLRGRRGAVIGRSEIVGKPIALLLMHEDVTVTICHSKTPDLPAVTREADILVVAMGRPAFVDDSFVKPGAAVIDVGTNRVDSRERIREIFGEDAGRLADFEKKGYTLAGDVHAAKVLPKCSYLSPVPGGVGPLTIAMLMANTVRASTLRRDLIPAAAERPQS